MKPLLDARGVAVSTRNSESLARFDAALASLHSLRGDALALINQALERDPDFVAGHCLRAAAVILSSEVPHESSLGDTIEALDRLLAHANQRERRHAQAARAWFAGDTRRARAWR